MLNRYARAFFTAVLTPTARFLLRIGVGPDTVTIVGTLGAVVSALVFFPRGDFFVGTLAVTAFIFSDLVDGNMARQSGRSSKWGAFLDSTMDRVGDAAIFGGLAYYFADRHDTTMFILAAVCLVSGAIVSYVRAKAEGLGFDCNVGIVERAERLVGSLVATGLAGLGVPYVQAIALWAIALGSSFTVGQRMLHVRKQALPTGGSPVPLGEQAPGGGAGAPDDAPGGVFEKRPGGTAERRVSRRPVA
jgi:CDP-diacylglycerol---glycerol-3-phosphate 3-phosphatidyltransferase